MSQKLHRKEFTMNWLKSLFTLTILLFLSACHQSGRSASDGTTVSTPGAPDTSVKSDDGGGVSRSGPSDGGGGDTCNGKMIESYKVDINELEEFKNFVYPIFEKLGKGGEVSPIFMAPHLKTWYIIDCKLQDIPKERKGLYLETYQTAIHTQREIFIESASYNKMEEIEKGKLLLHEIVMALYLLKYTSFKDMCKAMNTCQGNIDLMDRWTMFRPLPFKPLDDIDHQKIRYVTSWLIKEKDNLSLDKFKEILINNDFDRRFDSMTRSSNSENVPHVEKKVEINVDDIVKMLKRYQYTQKFPENCQFDPTTGLSGSKCTTDISVTTDDKTLVIKLKIVRASDKKTFEHEFKMPIVDSNRKLSLSVSKYPTVQGPVLSFTPMVLMANWPTMSPSEVEEGHQSQLLYIMMDSSNPKSPEVYQLVMQTLVWYSFEKEVKVENDYTTTIRYGYSALLEKESEALFVEKEQPYDTNRSFLPEGARQMVGYVSLYTPKPPPAQDKP